MRLTFADAAFVELRPLRYQFGHASQPTTEHDWDANWLVIHGDIGTADHRRWSFTDPCLTTWEARSLSHWLRAVATGSVSPTTLDQMFKVTVDDAARLLCFTEPNIALSLSEQTADQATLRVHLSLEASPPLQAGTPIFEYFLPLIVTGDQLRRAADDWDHDLEPFPQR